MTTNKNLTVAAQEEAKPFNPPSKTATVFPNGEVYEVGREAGAAAPDEGDDKRRLDWLETMVVNVRVDLPYGSHDLFWASPEEQDAGPSGPSDIRARIDAAMSAAPASQRGQGS